MKVNLPPVLLQKLFLLQKKFRNFSSFFNSCWCLLVRKATYIHTLARNEILLFFSFVFMIALRTLLLLIFFFFFAFSFVLCCYTLFPYTVSVLKISLRNVLESNFTRYKRTFSYRFLATLKRYKLNYVLILNLL